MLQMITDWSLLKLTEVRHGWKSKNCSYGDKRAFKTIGVINVRISLSYEKILWNFKKFFWKKIKTVCNRRIKSVILCSLFDSLTKNYIHCFRMQCFHVYQFFHQRDVATLGGEVPDVVDSSCHGRRSRRSLNSAQGSESPQLTSQHVSGVVG